MPSIKSGGRRFWRSLDELADSPKFRRFVENEFPAYAEEMLAPASRRSFLKFMGASMALAGMTACRWPAEEIVPFASRPEGYLPGQPRQYATAMELGGVATGLLVTSYDGRPVKIEGNPEHRQSLGATAAWHQASLLELYDPDRSQNPVRIQTGPATWDEFDRVAGEHFAGLRARRGAGLRLLSGASSSPSLARLRDRLLREFPEAGWCEYEPLSRDNGRDGSTLALGRPHRTHLALDRAETIVSLDEDFLLHHPAAVRYARDFVRGRDPGKESFSRLYQVESCFSLTGSVADRRFALPARMIPVFAVCLAAELFIELGLPLPAGASRLERMLERIQAHPLYTETDFSFARELMAHRGACVVVAGPRMPVEIHALVHVINQALGGVGRTVSYTADPEPDRPHHQQAIRSLAREISENAVDTLVVLGGNPVYDAPADLDFGTLLSQVETSIRLGLHEDETSEDCTWHLPRAHFLESWGDARDYGGTISTVQPLIEPLFGGRSDIELLAGILGRSPRSGYEIVRQTFAESDTATVDERRWGAALHGGFRPDTEWPVAEPKLRIDPWADRLEPLLMVRQEWGTGEYELVFVEDASVVDGRFANNGWLQETPDPLSKITWDNAAMIAPETAAELGLEQGDRVRLTRNEVSVELPVFLMPGQAASSIAVAVGYGRRRAGTIGSGVGVDVYPLRAAGGTGWSDVRVERAAGHYELATTQDHFALDALGMRERSKRAAVLVREIEWADYRADPAHAMHAGHEIAPVELWKPHEYPGHRWGMAIDLNACIGCNSCMVACQAENNIPVVGRKEVAMGREMHWIRVDRYFSGDPVDPNVSFQPVTCHHCENAPCESVCPVAATVHDHEGLNVMVYNRCVGTRYCANNCPYKVRRFNYFNNHKNDSPLEAMAHNPEVTLRSRGVMEKCSFCLQRINKVKIQARNERLTGERSADGGPLIRDGEVVPACAQACPTRAIAFGDLNDSESRVLEQHHSDRAYAMLEETNIRPRTRYLARVRNRGSADPHGEGAA